MMSRMTAATRMMESPGSTSSQNSINELNPSLSRFENVLLIPNIRLNPVLTGSGPIPKVGLVYDELMLKHDASVCPDHVERPARLEATYRRHLDQGLVKRSLLIQSREATMKEVCSVHSGRYVRSLQNITAPVPGGEFYDPAEDTYYNKFSYKCALTAAGCVLNALAAVVEKRCKSAVALVRPPGHHAKKENAAGFCILNSVAIAAKAANDRYDVERTLVFDWDVHHGNGIQEAFKDDPSVLYISIHRYDNGKFYLQSNLADYSFVGIGPGTGYNVNIPWNTKGMGDTEYLTALENVVIPIAREYCPELILVAAGFDAGIKDENFGGNRVSPAGFAEMTRRLSPISNGHIILALEGGYDPAGTADSMTLYTRVLLGDTVQRPEFNDSCDSAALDSLRNVMQTQVKYWKDLGPFLDKTTLGPLEIINTVGGSDPQPLQSPRNGHEVEQTHLTTFAAEETGVGTIEDHSYCRVDDFQPPITTAEGERDASYLLGHEDNMDTDPKNPFESVEEQGHYDAEPPENLNVVQVPAPVRIRRRKEAHAPSSMSEEAYESSGLPSMSIKRKVPRSYNRISFNSAIEEMPRLRFDSIQRVDCPSLDSQSERKSHCYKTIHQKLKRLQRQRENKQDSYKKWNYEEDFQEAVQLGIQAEVLVCFVHIFTRRLTILNWRNHVSARANALKFLSANDSRTSHTLMEAMCRWLLHPISSIHEDVCGQPITLRLLFSLLREKTVISAQNQFDWHQRMQKEQLSMTTNYFDTGVDYTSALKNLSDYFSDLKQRERLLGSDDTSLNIILADMTRLGAPEFLKTGIGNAFSPCTEIKANEDTYDLEAKLLVCRPDKENFIIANIPAYVLNQANMSSPASLFEFFKEMEGKALFTIKCQHGESTGHKRDSIVCPMELRRFIPKSAEYMLGPDVRHESLYKCKLCTKRGSDPLNSSKLTWDELQAHITTHDPVAFERFFEKDLCDDEDKAEQKTFTTFTCALCHAWELSPIEELKEHILKKCTVCYTCKELYSTIRTASRQTRAKHRESCFRCFGSAQIFETQEDVYRCRTTCLVDVDFQM